MLVRCFLPLFFGLFWLPLTYAQTCLNNNRSLNSKALFIVDCVNTCVKFSRNSSAQGQELFAKNCSRYFEGDQHPIKKLLNNFERGITQCMPLTYKKVIMGPIQFIRDLPKMISYVIANADATQKQWQECGKNPVCRRGLARNLAGFYSLSDSEIDRKTADWAIEDLIYRAQSDHAMMQDNCNILYSHAIDEQLSKGDMTPYALQKAAFARLSEMEPLCPGVLSLEPPVEPKPKQTVEQCVKANPDNPYPCLGFREKLAYSYLCVDPEAETSFDKQTLEYCSEVNSVWTPLPLLGIETRAIGAVSKKVETVLNAGLSKEAAIAAREGDAVTETANVVDDAVGDSTKLKRADRDGIVNDLADETFTTPEQNGHFISEMEDTVRVGQENKTRVVDVENAFTRDMNTATKDKRLVSSVTNIQKATLLKNLEALKAKYPDIKFDLYSDFKSTKIAMRNEKGFTPELSNQLLKDVDGVFLKTNNEFEAIMRKMKIEIPEVGPSANWFKAGYGRTIDEAAVSARYAREAEGSPRVFDFHSEEVTKVMNQRLRATEAKRVALVANPNFKKLLEKTRDGISLPSEGAFDLARKASDPAELAQMIRDEYRLKNFTTADAKQLMDYATGVNTFSPTLLIKKREILSLDEADMGALTGDAPGLSAANARATAAGIAQKPDLISALHGARLGEKEVTRRLVIQAKNFRRIVGGKVTRSGDDLQSIFTKPYSLDDKLKKMNRIARNPNTRRFRLAFIGEDVPKAFRDQLTARGESIERSLRRQLREKRFDTNKLNRMAFGFDMQTVKLNDGTVNLLIGKNEFTRLTPQEVETMQAAFAAALKENNSLIGAKYIQGQAYTREADIRFVPGVGILGVVNRQMNKQAPPPEDDNAN